MRSMIPILILASSSALAQVPVIREPQPFVFPRHDVASTTNPSTQVTGITQPQHSYRAPSQQEVNKQIMQEVDNFQRTKELQRQQALEAFAQLDANTIHYEFKNQEGAERDRYENAFTEMNKMLKSGSPINLKRAVFLVENAYDPNLSYDDFEKLLKHIAFILKLKMKQDRISHSDNIGKIMTLFQFMADTITVKNPATEKTITTFPKTYDFNDFWGKKDYSKMFVSKLIRTGSGQCHSLPLLFLLLADEIQAKASLAFAPNHSFIKFQDKKGKWYNIELTTGMLTSDHFMIESGYIKAEAMQSRIYLEPLKEKEVIAQCMNDLTMGYLRRFGYDDFALKTSSEVLMHVPNSISAHQIYSNYYNQLLEFVVVQYMQKGFTQQNFKEDANAMHIYKEASAAVKKIDQLGYADMPPEAYEAWLNSCKKEAMKQEHLNKVGILQNMIQH